MTVPTAPSQEPAAPTVTSSGQQGSGSRPQSGSGASTRERILDIALDLFTEQGFDKTSLREIAEKLGYSKAAVYYHFASKDDILMALHMRLHDVGRDALTQLGQQEITVESWGILLDELIDQILVHRGLFILHERNRAALEHLHDERHDASHDDLLEQLRQVISNPDTPVRDRIRMTCSFGAIFSTLAMSGDAFDDVPSEELGDMVRDAVHDLLQAP